MIPVTPERAAPNIDAFDPLAKLLLSRPAYADLLAPSVPFIVEWRCGGNVQARLVFHGIIVARMFYNRDDVSLARVGIATRTVAAVDDTGLALPSRPCIVSVIIPTDDEQVTMLYRRGNRVQLRGVIERLATRSLRNKVVADHVASLDTEWSERREEIKGLEDQEKARKELNMAGGRYVRDRDRFSRIVRTAMLAIEVTPMAGAQPATREEGVEERARFDAEQREQRHQRRLEQRARRRDNKRREAVARTTADGEHGEEPAPVAEPATGEAPTVVAPVKHRRQPKVAEVKAGADTSVPDAELATTEPLAEVEAPHVDGVLVEA